MNMQQSTHRDAETGAPQSSLQTQVAIGAAVFAVLLAASGLLWARYGEAVYIERILGAIASCL